ncbi:winged helix-turn-helix domain-containing protein [Streptomyces silvisoli]|uniref:Helix-turn-helix domain-containing protein n=1 Tax=Streptomyces silvisoli TaxID=3034235 RepID=A0ABT5ZEW5_9ACTN|nr:helix-turn-helix domain-containing protein [Streptomyces silvisoli]MDF3288236.1 helix-turn-helix domain-containing protein [Streptomyces silvisoli]
MSEPSASHPVSTIHLTDPRALRAYAHPTRMRLVGLLRSQGPLTATQAAELTGESVASCSYHLRMLAKYGLVETAEGGQGREKPWQATARFTSWPNSSGDAAIAEASDALSHAVVERYFELMTRRLEARRGDTREWREAEQISDIPLYLTAAELAELGERMNELLRPYADRLADPGRRPDGARLVTLIRAAIPSSPDPAERSR